MVAMQGFFKGAPAIAASSASVVPVISQGRYHRGDLKQARLKKQNPAEAGFLRFTAHQAGSNEAQAL
jgi:hypothetical protein